ncbi:ribonuclease HI family protein [Pontibacillus litoralis]|uniref:Ribonuclease H n=1 Tax=Pontibacillus litoralis JSM 072002 TaxID=1385512 RepID=A0A0A5G466_9BACI|nr:ribonuclease HI family protein [Pontibacillus litoralis]KGX87911.1 ribonuclease H [Pontibacillus litoralis JSM 072002]
MIEVYVDGASQGDPGPSGAGIYIKHPNEQIEQSIMLEEMSNHEAEFHALIHALQLCQQRFPNEILSVRSDSKLVVDSVEKQFTKNSRYQHLLRKSESLIASFPYVFIKWIPSKQNKRADQLARQAIHPKNK